MLYEVITVHANSPGDRLPPFAEELIEDLAKGFLRLNYFIDTENPEKFIIWVRPQSWNGNQSVLSTVITSYSIHYTKLYEGH